VFIKSKKLALCFFACLSINACRGKSESGSASDTLAANAIKPDQAGYDDQSAAAKQKILWQQIEKSKYDSPPEWSGTEPLAMFALALNPVRSVVRNFFNVSMDRNSDVLPEGRKKGIHTYGSVASITFVADPNNPFSGLYQGVSHGLIRLSLAVKPSATSMVPGAAVKFFIDGKPSMNFVAMYSLDGQEGDNFFANEFFTSIKATESGALKVLAAAFRTATEDPTKVDVAYLATLNQDGSAFSEPVAPERLVMVPNRKLVTGRSKPRVPNFESSEDKKPLGDDLATIDPGTTLYEVYGIRAGSESRIHIGHIATSSAMLSSPFGDQKLFFRHQRFNNK